MHATAALRLCHRLEQLLCACSVIGWSHVATTQWVCTHTMTQLIIAPLHLHKQLPKSVRLLIGPSQKDKSRFQLEVCYSSFV